MLCWNPSLIIGNELSRDFDLPIRMHEFQPNVKLRWKFLCRTRSRICICEVPTLIHPSLINQNDLAFWATFFWRIFISGKYVPVVLDAEQRPLWVQLTCKASALPELWRGCSSRRTPAPACGASSSGSCRGTWAGGSSSSGEDRTGSG